MIWKSSPCKCWVLHPCNLLVGGWATPLKNITRNLQNPWNRRYLENHHVFRENLMFFHVPCLCSLKLSWFPSFASSQLACVPPMYCYHPQHGNFFWISLTLPAWCHCCSNKRPHGSVKYKAKSCWKLAIMSLKQCSFSSWQKPYMISP